MAYLLAGPLVAIVGIAAVYFVLRRKSVDKRSMYTARREQIQHKVRAARQRTLAKHGHVDKAPEAAATGASPFAQTEVQPTVTYEAPVFSPPPAAPLERPAPLPREAPAPMPWEQPSIPPPATMPMPAPSSFDFPSTPAEPVEPVEPPPPPMEQVAPAASSAASTSAGSWSVVATTKESGDVAEPIPQKKKKGKRAATVTSSSWQLASGDEPGMATDEGEVQRQPSGTLVAVAQYAVLVVGLVMVLIGVLVMVANSHVT